PVRMLLIASKNNDVARLQLPLCFRDAQLHSSCFACKVLTRAQRVRNANLRSSGSARRTHRYLDSKREYARPCAAAAVARHTLRSSGGGAQRESDRSLSA